MPILNFFVHCSSQSLGLFIQIFCLAFDLTASRSVGAPGWSIDLLLLSLGGGLTLVRVPERIAVVCKAFLNLSGAI